MKKHLNWWKHLAFVYSPIWVTCVVIFLFVNGEPETVGEYAGTIARDFVIMSGFLYIIKRFFIKETQIESNFKLTIAILVSILLGSFFTFAIGFDLLISILAGLTLYLVNRKEYKPTELN